MNSEPYYVIQIPMIGHLNDRYSLCRCMTIESAVEVVRALLGSKDNNLSEITVVRGGGISQ